jgi:homoserine kinase type II
MAVFSPMPPADGDRLARAHGLGALRAVIPVPAGSVNSNFFLETEAGRFFARIYEEQAADGVAYEWSLLAHLAAHGVPVPARVHGPGPGELTIAGKPTAVFEIAGGGETCQAGVTAARARALGALLARAHRAAASFGQRRVGRFGLAPIGARLAGIQTDRAEVRDAIARLARTLPELGAAEHEALPSGVIHGDLFRDNVRWEGDDIVCALDWESASDGALAYDLAVALLAWCFGDAMRWDLAAAMAAGYADARPLEPLERASLRDLLRAGCVRFATTRITDYELRATPGFERVQKDYRRFLARLDAIEAETPSSLLARLGV